MMTFENLTWEELCDLMCGSPEEDIYDEDEDEQISNSYDS